MAGNHMSELSPRQRMINMMYLVLTALLALNVSKEVLKAFQRMDNSIEFSYGETSGYNDKQYKDFQTRAEMNPEKFNQWYEHAKNVQTESQEIINVLHSVKEKINELAGPIDKDGMLTKKDDKDLVKKLLVKGSDEKGAYGYGEKVKEARDRYKKFLLSLDSLGIYEGNQEIKMNIESLFTTEDVDEDLKITEDGEIINGPKAPVSWEHWKFDGHVPVAVNAFMAQMKLDVGSMEGAVLELLQKKIGQSSITVNSQRSVVKYPKQTIMLGDSFSARVFIAGVDTNQLPKFNLYKYDSQGNRLDSIPYDTLINDGSEGLFSTKPTKQGTYYFGGEIIIQSEEGEKSYPFKQEYRVDAPLSVISPDKMNVLYTQVTGGNPLSISVPGYSSDQLQLYSDFSGCKITRVKNGSYKAEIPQRQQGKNKREKINLYIKDKKTGKLVGKKIEFRVKNVPAPAPSVRGITGSGELKLIKLKSAKGIKAKLENFDFELEYEITSYRFRYPGSTGALKSASYQGWRFSEVKSVFETLKTGQTVIFDEIYYTTKGSKSKPIKLNQVINLQIN